MVPFLAGHFRSKICLLLTQNEPCLTQSSCGCGTWGQRSGVALALDDPRGFSIPIPQFCDLQQLFSNMNIYLVWIKKISANLTPLISLFPAWSANREECLGFLNNFLGLSSGHQIKKTSDVNGFIQNVLNKVYLLFIQVFKDASKKPKMFLQYQNPHMN